MSSAGQQQIFGSTASQAAVHPRYRSIINCSVASSDAQWHYAVSTRFSNKVIKLRTTSQRVKPAVSSSKQLPQALRTLLAGSNNSRHFAVENVQIGVNNNNYNNNNNKMASLEGPKHHVFTEYSVLVIF